MKKVLVTSLIGYLLMLSTSSQATVVPPVSHLTPADAAAVTNSKTVLAQLVQLERTLESFQSFQLYLQEQIASLQTEVDLLRGTIELQGKTISEMQATNRLVDATDSPESQLNETHPTPIVRPVNDTAAYQEAISRLHDRAEDQQTCKSLRAFLEQHATSKHVADAHYLLGTIYVRLQDQKSALTQFAVVIARHPTYSKRPDAMLKTAMLFKQNGDKEKAKMMFLKLQNEYPGTSAAQEAKEQRALIN